MSQELLLELFDCMKIKDHYIKAYPDITNFFSIIQEKIDPNIQMDQPQNFVLSKSQAYVDFKEKHCLTTTYTFQIKKCIEEDCTMCYQQPVHLPKEVFGQLHFIPALILVSCSSQISLSFEYGGCILFSKMCKFTFHLFFTGVVSLVQCWLMMKLLKNFKVHAIARPIYMHIL